MAHRTKLVCVVAATSLGLAGVALVADPAVARAGPPDVSSLYSDAPMVPQPADRTSATRAGVGRAGRAGSQCSGYLWSPDGGDAEQARNIMAGRFRLDRYGYMSLRRNPNWRNQASLDRSGNGMQHALWWALPLLRVGKAQNRPDMVARFYAIVDDWLRDNPPRRPRSSQAYGQIESGFRMITLACAAESAGSRARRYVRALRVQGKYAARRWTLVNNASFHQASGIFAAGCVTGKRALRRKALRFLDRSAATLIHPDGSVYEGSLEYARATYIWTNEELERVRACGVRPPGSLGRARSIPDFLAYGVRPDGRYEALGDGGAKIAQAGDAPDGSLLEFASTGGDGGATPPSLYARFAAGFLFGRSGWGNASTFGDQTFYSIRTGAGPAAVYHAHYDQAALTAHAAGGQMLFDGGPYSQMSKMRTRAAHNVVSIVGQGAGSSAPAVVTARSSADGDLTTLVDKAYRKAKITRTVWYDRVGDFFVVIDTLKQRKRRAAFQNWNLGRDRGAEVVGSAAHSTGSGGNVSIMSIGGQPSYSVLRGSRSPWGGWNSQFYSDIARAPSVRVAAGPAKRSSFVTVIVPRAEGVAATDVSATGEAFTGGALVRVTRGSTTYGLRITGSDSSRL